MDTSLNVKHCQIHLPPKSQNYIVDQVVLDKLYGWKEPDVREFFFEHWIDTPNLDLSRNNINLCQRILVDFESGRPLKEEWEINTTADIYIIPCPSINNNINVCECLIEILDKHNIVIPMPKTINWVNRFCHLVATFHTHCLTFAQGVFVELINANDSWFSGILTIDETLNVSKFVTDAKLVTCKTKLPAYLLHINENCPQMVKPEFLEPFFPAQD